MDGDDTRFVSRRMKERGSTYSTIAGSPAELWGSGKSCRKGCVLVLAVSKFPTLIANSPLCWSFCLTFLGIR